MDAFLTHRFLYGNSEWTGSSSPQSSKIYEAHGKVMKIIRQVRQQIEAQKMAGDEIARGNMEGHQIIAAEIMDQTEVLEKTTDQVLESIIGSVIMAADQISDSIDMLGNRLCIELTEIKWQLTQRDRKLDEILDVMRVAV